VFHVGITEVTVDMTRLIGPAFLFLTLISAATPAEALIPPTPGQTCYGSSAALQANFPLGTDSRETEIVNILGFAPSDVQDLAGWIYVNRRGNLFLMVRKGHNAAAATALREADSPQTARLAAAISYRTIMPVPTIESAGLVDRIARSATPFRCFTTALP
jgi:hypothetical protein